MLIGTLLLAVVGFFLGLVYHPLAIIVLPFLIWLFAFFRNPNRKIPADPNLMVSPADGTVSDITPIENDPLLGGPSTRVGIFLSVFNVHMNRSPCDARVISVQYKKGKFINAMKHSDASTQNESNTLVLGAPGNDAANAQPIAVVKQIVGLIARRIICTTSPGQTLSRGQEFGMIKFGSRTELTISNRLQPNIVVKIGQPVRGGADVIAILGKPAQPTDSAGQSSRENSAQETHA